MMKKIAAGITFYHPIERNIIKLELYKQIFDKVIVFDNTECEEDYQIGLINDDDIIYIINYKNCGLDKAYNYILNKCANDFDYLCILDQDSDFCESNINKVIEYINKNDMRDVGIIAPRIEYNSCDIKEGEAEKVVEKNWVIASGSFINLTNIYRQNITFDEAFFIDRFDVDFCKNVRNNSYKILMYQNAVLFQELGDKGKLSRPEHKAFRHYYIFRNRLYYNKKYFHYTWVIISMFQIIKHLGYILIFEHDPCYKIKECIWGLIDFCRGKMGKR